MKLNIKIILTVSIIGVSYMLAPSQNMVDEEELNDHCIRISNKRMSDLKRKFPFNKTSRIRIVSFKNPENKPDVEIVPVNHLPIENNRVLDKGLHESIELDSIQREKLVDIIYNYDYDKSLKVIMQFGDCYNPRNAIIFEDSNGKCVSYLEICFECIGYEHGPSKFRIPDFCFQKYSMLSDFFSTVGVKYGPNPSK